LVLFIKMMI